MVRSGAIRSRLGESMPDPRAAVLLLLVAGAGALHAEAEATRELYDFEDPAELAGLRTHSENVALDLSQDNGVTHGRSCARVVIRAGDGYATLVLAADRCRDWSGFAAIAFDVYQERAEKTAINVELWDGASRDYATRCTTATVVRAGRGTVLVPIDHAKRNGKEGRDWAE